MTIMETMPVGVVVERRKIDHPWQEWSWRACAAIAGAPQPDGWKELRSGDGWTQYHAATLALELHRKETEAYLYNLESPKPSLFVVLREAEGGGGGTLPVEVHLVTASPYEAQDYMDSGEDSVDAVPLPEVIAAWIARFVEAHHEPEKFVKRKRDKVRAEDHKFGKDPIFEQSGRTLGEASDEP